jgi:hypothetical protein
MDDAGRIELPADALAIAQRLVAEGLYPTVAEAAAEALRALDPSGEDAFDAEFLAELDRRCEAMDRGEMTGVPLGAFRAEIEALIRRIES